MIKPTLISFLSLFFFSFAIAETKQVTLDGYEPLIIYQADKVSDIFQGEELFFIERFDQEIKISPKRPYGSSYVQVVYKDGSIDTILIDIIPRKGTTIRQKSYLVNLRGSTVFTTTNNQDQQEDFANKSMLYGRINFTENTYFATEYRYQKNLKGEVLFDDYRYFIFGYKNNFLYLGTIMDTLLAPYYSQDTLDRGGRLFLTDGKYFDLDVWVTEDGKFSGQQLNLKKLKTRLQHSKGENDVASIYNYLNVKNFTFLTNIGGTIDTPTGETYSSFSEDILYSFRNPQSSGYTFRTIGGGFATAPQGAYSLNTLSTFPISSYYANATIGNKNISGLDELNRDYIKGLFLTTVNYRKIERGLTTSDSVAINNSFGGDVFTLGLDLSFSQQSGIVESNGYRFFPYLQYFFNGNKDAGWSIRTQYEINQSNYLSTDSSQTSSSNSVFLVKNRGVLNMGIGYGSGQNESNSPGFTSATSFNSVQSFVNYYLSLDKQLSATYIANFYENDAKTQSFNATAKYIPVNGYYLFTSAGYRSSENRFTNLSSAFFGFGLGFDLYMGESDIKSKYDQDNTYLTVKLYKDLNNNGKFDENDEYISNEDFLLNNETETLVGTSFRKKVLPNISNYISFNKDGYSTISEHSISIVGSKEVAVPVVKTNVMKYKIFSGSKEVETNISSSCNSNDFQINYEKKEISFNEYASCEFFPKIAGYNLTDSSIKNNTMIFNIEKQKTVIYMKFQGKRSTITYKGRSLPIVDNEIRVEIDNFATFNPDDFNLKNCTANPKLTFLAPDSKIVNISLSCK